MKNFILLIPLLLLTVKAKAQLQAHARPDTAWCSLQGYPKPRLGAIATSGIPPYTYSWSVDYPGQFISVLLDSPNRATPIIRQAPQQGIDSLDFIVEVTDATNTKAYDTVKVLFSRWVYILSQCVEEKAMADTVTLLGQTAFSNFPPFSSLLWSSGLYLSDSTVLTPRSWAPVNTNYVLYGTDRAGCRGGIGGCWVRVWPAGIRSEAPAADNIRIVPNPITSESRIEIPSDLLGGELRIFSIDGRLLHALPLQYVSTSLTTILPFAPGTYFYRIGKQGSPPRTGKLIVQQ